MIAKYFHRKNTPPTVGFYMKILQPRKLSRLKFNIKIGAYFRGVYLLDSSLTDLAFLF